MSELMTEASDDSRTLSNPARPSAKPSVRMGAWAGFGGRLSTTIDFS